MICRYKNRECKWAGKITFAGDPFFNEEPGMHTCTICYNDSIGRDITKCT